MGHGVFCHILIQVLLLPISIKRVVMLMVASLSSNVGFVPAGRLFCAIVDSEVLAETLSGFYPSLERHLAQRLLWRLGLEGTVDDASKLSALIFEAAKASQIGWDRLFHELYGGHRPDKSMYPGWQNSAELVRLADYASSLSSRQSKTAVQAMRAAPLISLEIDVVERIRAPIAASDDWSEFTQSLQDIRAFGQRLRA